MPWHFAFPLAQADAGAAGGPAADTSGDWIPILLKLLIVAAIFLVSLAGGSFLSRRFRLPDHAWRISLMLFVLVASVAIIGVSWLTAPAGELPFKLGIDLSGGVYWVFEIDKAKLEGRDVDMEKLIVAVGERVNPGGQKEVTIRRYGKDQIEVIVPELDTVEIERFEKVITDLGTLEFRILANRRDHLDLINAALEMPPTDHRLEIGGKEAARWVPIDPQETERPTMQGILADPDLADRVNRQGQPEVLVVIDQFNVTGENLADARADVDENGRPNVTFAFDARGANLFGGLTADNLPDPATEFKRHLGIVLNDTLKSAPTINSVIRDRGEITGDFKQEEVDRIVGVLNAGALPAALRPEPISKLVTGPTLGRDTIRKGTVAMLASIVVTVLFMAFYYRFAGMIAGTAVVVNLLLTLAVAITIQAPFTLPGLAGLALTLGMAVDANVLIYERMREELGRGATLRMAIRNGFARAMSAIIDSNLTTLITATVLYWIGTDQIKGFAVMLWIGIVISMFTAIFCSRVVFDVFEKMRWITGLRMRQFVGATNFNFIGWWRPAMAVSLVLVVLGIAAMAHRGKGMLNIDFIGGASETMLFRVLKPERTIAQIREKVADVEDVLPDATITDVTESDEPVGLRYKLETSNKNSKEVQKQLKALFGDELATVTMEFGDLKTIAETEATDESEARPSEEGAGTDGASPATPDDGREGPEEGEGARSDAPGGRLVAAAGDVQSALLAVTAQDTDADRETTDEDDPEAVPPTAEVESTAEIAPVAEDEAPASDDAGGQDGAEDEAATGEDEADARPGDAAADEDLFLNGTSAHLSFVVDAPVEAGERLREADISYGALENAFKAAFRAAGIEEKPFELTNEDYVQNSNVTFSEWDVKVALDRPQTERLLAAVRAELGRAPYFPASSSIGERVAGSTSEQAIYALLASIVFIVLYLWIRFQKVMYGLAAIVALVHDVLVTLAFLAASAYVAPFMGWALIDPFKLDLTVMAAVLTIIGYSLNDTIVVFDRVREVKGKSPDLTLDMVNASANQTLSRTILTGLTTMMVVLILYFWGGPSIHGFAFALFVGMITGTYSSIYIAAPVLLWVSGKRGRAPARGATREQAAASASGTLSKLA